MGIFQRSKKEKGQNHKIPTEYLNVLRRLSYSEDFDLPREASKLARVLGLEMRPAKGRKRPAKRKGNGS